jgi:peptidoglycan/LPS O-acetylase OafA/YrhL
MPINVGATNAATSNLRRTNAARGGGGGTKGGEPDPLFCVIGLAVSTLIGAPLLMALDQFGDHTVYYVFIGIAAGVLAIAVAYLIYRCVRQARAERAKTAPEGAPGGETVTDASSAAMQLPLMVARI